MVFMNCGVYEGIILYKMNLYIYIYAISERRVFAFIGMSNLNINEQIVNKL